MNSCPICTTEMKFKFVTKDYLVTGESFDIVECEACSIRTTTPFPDKKIIGNYYSSDDYISHDDKVSGIFDSIYGLVRTYQLNKKKKLIGKYFNKSNGKILDIGCGAGDFLQYMKENHWNINGVDTSNKARKIANKKLNIKVMDPKDWINNKEKYDVITCWHSLEHVHEPWVYLDKIKKSLTLDGFLIVALPNYQSTDAKIYKEFWAAYDTPRHLYHFTIKSMNKTIKPHGLNIESIYRMNFDPFYVSMLSAKHMGKSFMSGLINGFKSWTLSIFSKDKCSSLIFIIKKNA
jgi:SAM-dependent methyltransferase|tara:strand:- start:6999 stop:7871 length:873 start_codon:yes stop_codon:yes gene_type:complete